MLRPLIVICLLIAAIPAAPPPRLDNTHHHTIAEEKPLRALDAWLKLYRAGKIDLTSKEDIAKDSLALKYGVVPKNSRSNKPTTWADDLELILDAVALLDDAAASQALLEVAAIGIDQGKYTREMAPGEARAAGERCVSKLRSAAAKEEICKAARGEMRVEKSRAVAFRAAAAKCIGLLADQTLRTVLEPMLGDSEEIVRVNAAEALGKLADEQAADALIALVEHETNDAVLMTAAQSLRAIFAKHVPSADAPAAKGAAGDGSPAKGAPDTGAAGEPGADAKALPPSIRRAVLTSIGALGRTTWRADRALVTFLDTFRALESVPALIGVLERFRDHPEDTKSGKLSGLLQFQVHELLVAMTGASFAADQPEKWRQLWETEKDNLRVTETHEPKGGGATSAGNFCGIPIEGTRVVFILDLSGSMEWPMRGQADAGSKKKGPSGLDFAKQELRRAMSAIAPNAQFNLITFNGDSRAELWNKDLVVASEKNRERFLKFVDGLKARGGTNLWSALEEAMKIKSMVYNTRYESTLDEIFVLSDGAPSVGEVIDPVEILRLVKETNRFASMRINTVFVKTEPPDDQRQAVPKMDMPPEELMKSLAEQNGGKFENL
jgi:hypothetical protein